MPLNHLTEAEQQALAARLQAVRGRIAAAEQRFGRVSGEVVLLAVSKTMPAAAIAAAASAGQRHFGENYLQEALQKIHALEELDSDLKLEWHFIGPLQSNKTRVVAENFAWVHSVDRVKIAQRLSDQRPAELPALNVLLQVNIDAEPSKSGLAPQVDLLAEAAAALHQLPRVKLRGLMAIPAPRHGIDAQREPLAHLREIQQTLNQANPALRLDTLSMGMSDDLEAAVAEQATIVRIGSAVFGPRPG